MFDGRKFPQVRMAHMVGVGGEVGLDLNIDNMNLSTPDSGYMERVCPG